MIIDIAQGFMKLSCTVKGFMKVRCIQKGFVTIRNLFIGFIILRFFYSVGQTDFEAPITAFRTFTLSEATPRIHTLVKGP